MENLKNLLQFFTTARTTQAGVPSVTNGLATYAQGIPQVAPVFSPTAPSLIQGGVAPAVAPSRPPLTDAQLQILSIREGYPISQKNGQRYFGPKLQGTLPPRRGCEICALNLPRDAYEDELVPFFRQAGGEIYQMRLMMDFDQSSRGFCFVTYTSHQEALNAVLLLNNEPLRPHCDKRVKVKLSVDNIVLMVRGLPFTVSEDELRQEITGLTQDIDQVIVYTDPFCARQNDGGEGFIQYSSHRAAAQARRVLISPDTKLWGISVQFDWGPSNFTLNNGRERFTKEKLLGFIYADLPLKDHFDAVELLTTLCEALGWVIIMKVFTSKFKSDNRRRFLCQVTFQEAPTADILRGDELDLSIEGAKQRTARLVLKKLQLHA